MADSLDQTPAEQIAARAVNHALTRAQVCPDFAHRMGGTETWDLLCEAEAALRGENVDDVRKRRQRSLVPAHRPQVAREVELAERLERLERFVGEHDLWDAWEESEAAHG